MFRRAPILPCLFALFPHTEVTLGKLTTRKLIQFILTSHRVASLSIQKLSLFLSKHGYETDEHEYFQRQGIPGMTSAALAPHTHKVQKVSLFAVRVQSWSWESGRFVQHSTTENGPFEILHGPGLVTVSSRTYIVHNHFDVSPTLQVFVIDRAGLVQDSVREASIEYCTWLGLIAQGCDNTAHSQPNAPQHKGRASDEGRRVWL